MPKDRVCAYDRCTGCALCSSICPAKAITMTYDGDGFYSPVIDANKCTDCGLCSRRCAANHTPVFQTEESDCYLCWARNGDVRRMGSSGGIFPVIAKQVLSKGGCVAGAAFRNGLKLGHTIIENEKDLFPLCGSKYIQSETEHIYKEVSDKLSQGRLVLFVGTPCQIAAVYEYCGRADNLITCDLICYGVGSTAVFNACIGKEEQRYHSRAVDVRFRKKVYGCRNSSMSITFENGREHRKIFYLSDYGVAYARKLVSRQSCYHCPFSSAERMGDFTLGDYTAPDINQVSIADIKEGLSLLRVNSEKGRAVFAGLSDAVYCEKKENSYIQQNSVRQRKEQLDIIPRTRFLEDFHQYGVEYAARKHCRVPLKRRLTLRFDTQYLRIRRLRSKNSITPKK